VEEHGQDGSSVRKVRKLQRSDSLISLYAAGLEDGSVSSCFLHAHLRRMAVSARIHPSPRSSLLPSLLPQVPPLRGLFHGDPDPVSRRARHPLLPLHEMRPPVERRVGGAAAAGRAGGVASLPSRWLMLALSRYPLHFFLSTLKTLTRGGFWSVFCGIQLSSGVGPLARVRRRRQCQPPGRPCAAHNGACKRLTAHAKYAVLLMLSSTRVTASILVPRRRPSG
jgi:hypothetical protein